MTTYHCQEPAQEVVYADGGAGAGAAASGAFGAMIALQRPPGPATDGDELDDDVGLAERAHLDVLAVDAALPAVELLEPGRRLVDQRVRARRGHGGLGGWFLRWRCGCPRIVSCCVRRRAAASDDVEEDFVALAGHGLAVVILRSLQLQHAAVKGRCAE